MDRRTLLKILAATALTGCKRRSIGTRAQRVVVAGAGIIGTSIAYHLAKSGASVTVIDKQGPATHASRGTFAWINATWAKQPQHYHALSQASVAYWKGLHRSLNLPIKWGGSLEWFTSQQRQEKLTAQIAEQVRWGEPARMLNSRELAEFEPNIKFDASTAAYSPNDGAVDPVIATQVFLDRAKRLGAKVTYPSELTDVSLSGGRLESVETSTGTIPADRLVLATGAAPNITRRIAGIDIPQRTTPGAIVITEPMPQLLNRVISAPGVHMHQRNDGRIVLGEQGGAPKNEAHDLRLKDRPNEFPARIFAEEHAQRILAIAHRYVPAIADAKLDSAYIGWRPLPLDGHPVLGASTERPDIYLAIMHSGVTLAPIVGQLVSVELSQNVGLERLEPYRPTRAFTEVKRY